MLKYLLAFLIAVTASVLGQSSPNAALAQLGASGVTTNGGTTNYANYLIKLGPDGKLNTAAIPANSSSLYTLNRIRVVDAVNGLDSSIRNGSTIQPYRTLKYAMTNGSPVAPILLLAPGQYGAVTVDTGLYPNLTNITMIGLAPGAFVSSIQYLGAAGAYDVVLTLQNMTVSSTLSQEDKKVVTLALREYVWVELLRITDTNCNLTLDPTAHVNGYSSTAGGLFVITPSAPSTQISYGTNTVSSTLDSVLSLLESATNYTVSYAYPLATNPSNYMSYTAFDSWTNAAGMGMVIYTQSLVVANDDMVGVNGLYTFTNNGFSDTTGYGRITNIPPWTIMWDGTSVYTNSSLYGVMYSIPESIGAGLTCTVAALILTNVLPAAVIPYVENYAYPLSNPSNFISVSGLTAVTSELVSTNVLMTYAYPRANPSNFMTHVQFDSWTNSQWEASTYLTYMVYSGNTGILVNIYTQGLVIAGSVSNLDGTYSYNGTYFVQDGGGAVGNVISVPPWTLANNSFSAYTNSRLEGLMYGVNGYPGTCTSTVVLATNIIPMADRAFTTNYVHYFTTNWVQGYTTNWVPGYTTNYVQGYAYPNSNPSNFIAAFDITNNLPYVPTSDIRYLSALTDATVFATAEQGAAGTYASNTLEAFMSTNFLVVPTNFTCYISNGLMVIDIGSVTGFVFRYAIQDGVTNVHLH